MHHEGVWWRALADVVVGSEPNLLSETSDGNYFYIGLSGALSLGRFNLLTQTLDLTVPLPTNESYGSGDVAAAAMATVPGSDTSLAVEPVGAYSVGILDICISGYAGLPVAALARGATARP